MSTLTPDRPAVSTQALAAPPHVETRPRQYPQPTRSPFPTVSVVVPVRNEARNLEIVLPRLPDVHQVILVDGNSVDGTVETIQPF